MPKDINVLVIEDDTYARDLMGMLLTRDWRTRVIAEIGSEDDLKAVLSDPVTRVGAIVLDTEVPFDPEWPFRVANLALDSADPPAILCTGTKVDPDILRRLVKGGFHGYMLKRELAYSIAAAVAMAVKQNMWIVTPQVYRKSLQLRIALPANAVLVDGRKPVAQLTPREAEIARLAILFNHPHRELSDELLIRADQVSKHVSSTYTKLGLEEILSGEIDPEIYFQDKLILRHFQRILKRVESARSRRKTADMATLAFHLLTVPEVRPII